MSGTPDKPRMHTAGAPRIGSKRPDQQKRTPTVAELDTNPVAIGRNQAGQQNVRKSMLGNVIAPSQEPEAESRAKTAKAPRKHDETGQLFHTGEFTRGAEGTPDAGKQIEKHVTSVCYCLRSCCWLPATPVKRKRATEDRSGKVIPERPATSSTKEEQVVTRYTGVCVCYQCPCNGWKPTSTMPMIRMAK